MTRPAHRAPHRAPNPFRDHWALVAALVTVLVTALVVIADIGTSGGSPDDTLVSDTALQTSQEQTEDPVTTTSPSADSGVRHRRLRTVPGLVIHKDYALIRQQKAQAKAAEEAAQEKKELATAPFSFQIGTFNVLGSQHTGPGGDRKGWAPASQRTPRAAAVAARHGVDILGTQELQADQLRQFQAQTGMAAYPGFAWGEAETDNSILWDPSQFELVESSQFTIPFMGRPRPQPIIKLRHLATGREFYVVNTHPSAHDGRYAVERRQGQSALVGIVNDLQSSGLPVLVTGDMNDREAFYCNVMPQSGMVAPNGGSYSGGCHPPPYPLPVDWVVGSGVTWSNYWRDPSTTEQRISDHIFVSATANVG